MPLGESLLSQPGFPAWGPQRRPEFQNLLQSVLCPVSSFVRAWTPLRSVMRLGGRRTPGVRTSSFSGPVCAAKLRKQLLAKADSRAGQTPRDSRLRPGPSQQPLEAGAVLLPTSQTQRRRPRQVNSPLRVLCSWEVEASRYKPPGHGGHGPTPHTEASQIRVGVREGRLCGAHVTLRGLIPCR